MSRYKFLYLYNFFPLILYEYLYALTRAIDVYFADR